MMEGEGEQQLFENEEPPEDPVGLTTQTLAMGMAATTSPITTPITTKLSNNRSNKHEKTAEITIHNGHRLQREMAEELAIQVIDGFLQSAWQGIDRIIATFRRFDPIRQRIQGQIIRKCRHGWHIFLRYRNNCLLFLADQQHRLAAAYRHYQQQKGPKAISRPFSATRTHLRSISNLETRNGKESVAGALVLTEDEFEEDEEEDMLESVSISGILTPPSTIGMADTGKISALEQQLAMLQKQVELLLKQQHPGNGPGPSQPSETSKPAQNRPAPPPPAPPLPPDLRNQLVRTNANNKLEVNKAAVKPDKENSGTLPPAPPPPTPRPAMVDILKDIGNVKLKKVYVNRSPGGAPTRPMKPLNLQNDNSLAGALARALDERRKKLKLDSDSLNDSCRELDESAEGWSDDDEKEEAGGVFGNEQPEC